MDTNYATHICQISEMRKKGKIELSYPSGYLYEFDPISKKMKEFDGYDKYGKERWIDVGSDTDR